MAKKKKKLAEYVLEDIRAMLLDGRLKEGDKLPNQNEFAKQLGVSRLTLREALQTLELMGVVAQSPKTGTVILSGNPDHWGITTTFTLKDEDDTRQMLLARSCVEPAIAREALRYMTTSQIEHLTRIYYEMYDAYRVSNVEAYLAKDKEFHLFIAESCENRYLLLMYEVALSQVDIFMKNVFNTIPEAFEKTVRLHRAIYEGLAEKDGLKLMDAVRLHSAFIAELIMRFFKKHDSASAEGSLYYP